MTSSPKFKNLGTKPKQSPIEIKEKMRKNYKSKIQNCRGMLMDKIRGSVIEKDLCNTLTDIYKSLFSTHNDDDEEYEFMEEVKNELIQEELDWLLKEHEKAQLDNVDWASIEEDNNVICPVCQKTNIDFNINYIDCPTCNIAVATQKSRTDIKNTILQSVDSHNSACASNVQFAVVADDNGAHIYLICDTCSEMKIII